ncbi:unnamed protein product [Cylindrotheca closterium]|uniref:Uncharacterized protein n=1 Tax=Cylindrotheca closterium TaxID=2856 RepID=A0AAD2G845_9STRA|nr:unnamed protein product [Cylindrotheca closterium]
MMDGKPHGTGYMIYDHGRILCGNWLHGVFQGQGCALYENGDTAFGSFLKNKINGFTAYMTKFTKYVGQYHKNRRHGKGVFIDYHRGTYSGDFIEGRFEGLGMHAGMNGKITAGHFKNWIPANATIGSEAEHKESSSMM